MIGADGSGLRQVTHSPYSDGGIAWSRDGKLLAFTRFFKQTGCPQDQGRGDLFLIGSGGKSERRLTHSGCMFVSPRSPMFAPNGRTLAFDDDKGIFVAQGSSWQPRVASNHGAFPSWAPDSRRLVYEDGPTVEVVDTATHKITKIGDGTEPACSHGGGRIACIASSNQLWTTDAAGKHGKKVATKANMHGLAWSPDDRLIAFYSEDAQNRATSWVVPAAGGRPVKLGPGAFPAWAPGGNMLSLDAPTATSTSCDRTAPSGTG